MCRRVLHAARFPKHPLTLLFNVTRETPPLTLAQLPRPSASCLPCVCESRSVVSGVGGSQSAAGMFFLQWYSLATALLLDLVCVFRLAVLRQPLSLATMMWFDRVADSPQGAALLAVLLLYLALSKLLVAYDPLNRWTLLLAAAGETLRLGVFAALYADLEGATQLNTVALALFFYNAYAFWWNWSAMQRLFSRRSH
ncbi:uncharacterized protein Tco025E_05752 [Trypanosoma conorhini]|uniref:Uncharacterized protein n=1 Tax=Trypanosoma conorhini TaxID=83891 RepID=A0A3R7KWJ5_9TRYP|nr:uncharacterized protein Tco025E_05752 [Trypanosoma conorhini]RNF14858.1 hypothetical protein Tco025E_05752 [Trypanosoma conorhini]